MKICALIVTTLFISLSPLSMIWGASPGDVIISEIYPDPPSQYDGAEFIEFYNTTDSTIDISGWQIAGTEYEGTCGGEDFWAFPSGTEIQAHGYLVVAKDVDDDGFSQEFGFNPDFELYDESFFADADNHDVPNMILLTPDPAANYSDEISLIPGNGYGARCTDYNQYDALYLYDSIGGDHGHLIDAIEYWDPANCTVEPCSDVPGSPFDGFPGVELCLSRDASNTDTDNCRFDFAIRECTPWEPPPVGPGVATIHPDVVELAASELTETITIRSDSITIDQIEVDIPSGWMWETPGPMGIELSGPGFPDMAYFDTTQSNDSTIIIKGAAILDMDSGVIDILNLTAPSYPGYFTFTTKTNNIEIERSPRVYAKGVEKATLTVPPHPFAPDLGERLKIKYTAPANNDMVLKLFDLEGRVVVTLFDGLSTGELKPITWDGRNELFERVPIGVYILYLQATDRKTGEITTAKAPVVVATRLD